ncbi:MAG: SPOR domain-containing protein [Prolixibacteraceae bacterium]|nr:SPOR domain-containing protein [Prolixibacteraceae bacterium]
MPNINKHIVLNSCLTTIVLLCLSFFSMAQLSNEQAAKLFDKGKFDEVADAYEHFYQLYPGNANIQYRYAVCLTETDRKGNFARKLLLQAMQNDVPNDAAFYLAQNYHALGNFEKAIELYQRFDSEAKKKIKKKLGLNALLDAATSGQNPFTTVPEMFFVENKVDNRHLDDEAVENDELEQEQNGAEVLRVDSIGISADSLLAEQPQVPDQLQQTPVVDAFELPQGLDSAVLNFIVNPKIVYYSIKQFKTNQGLVAFAEGWSQNNELAKMVQQMQSLREQYNMADDASAKEQIAAQLLSLEPQSLQLKANADALLLEARQYEADFWNNAGAEVIETHLAENEQYLSVKSEEPVVEQIELQNEPMPADTVLIVENNDNEYVESVEEPVVIEQVTYRVQIGAYSKGLPDYIDRLYKKLSVLRRIDHYTDERGIVVYTVGELTSFDDAVKLQNQIRQEGVNDAFVVAYLNNKRISLNEARKLSDN